MNATECFKVTEIGRCDIDGVEFVGYYDGARSYAVLGSDYDQVERLIADIDEYEPAGATIRCGTSTGLTATRSGAAGA